MNKPSIRFETATADDAPAIAAALSRSVREVAAGYYAPDLVERWAAEYTIDRALHFIVTPGYHTVLALDERGSIVGVGSIDIGDQRIAQCYVTGGAARSGVGSRVLAKLESMARDAGLTWVHLLSSTGACAFYERNGYVSSGPLQWYEEDYEVFPYRKDLPG